MMKTILCQESLCGTAVARRGLNRRGFTLLELLAVMALMGLLMVLAAPVLNPGSKLAGSGNRIVALVDRARQHSASNNVMTALVLITDANTGGDYRAFTLLEYNAENSALGWKQVAPWENLPPGVMVDTDVSGSTFLSNTVHPLPFTHDSMLPAKYQGASISSYACRVFLPAGGLTNPASPARIQLVEGQLKGANVVYTRPGAGGGSANWYAVAIVGATGRGIVERP